MGMATRNSSFVPDLPRREVAVQILKIILWTIVYYVTSAASGVWNKWLVDSKDFSVSPTFLTWFHLVIALGSDAAIMLRSPEETTARRRLQAEHHRTAQDVLVAFMPIAVFVILSKLTTYLSYQYVSIALSHTAKASEPIFNVIVAAVVFGEYHSPAIYASLVPISLGILLASVSELSYNHYGFAVAASSALMKVLQNIYTKRLMTAGKWTFWEVHLYCGAASLLMMLPVMWVTWVSLKHSAFTGHLPYAGLLLDAILQWASSVSAYVVLSLVAHLTATIINTFKRVVMITSGAFMDPAARFTPVNMLGVAMAGGGILLYNIVRDSEALQATIHSHMGKATQTLGLHVPLPAWMDAWAEKQQGNNPGGRAAVLPLAPAEGQLGSAGAYPSTDIAYAHPGQTAAGLFNWAGRGTTRVLATILPSGALVSNSFLTFSRSRTSPQSGSDVDLEGGGDRNRKGDGADQSDSEHAGFLDGSGLSQRLSVQRQQLLLSESHDMART